MKSRSMARLVLFGCVLALALAGEQRTPPQSETKTAAKRQAGGSATTAPAKPAGLSSDYRIGPGDVLTIDVWKEPEASIASVTVRPDGRISLPIIGEVEAAGQTPLDLQRTATEKYSQFIHDPRVNVSVRDAGSQRVYVIGEVRREGAIRLTTPMTVLQTLAEAGGLTDYAKRKNIYILRTQNGQQVKLAFDYDAVLRGQKVQQNITLMAGDTIVVPR